MDPKTNFLLSLVCLNLIFLAHPSSAQSSPPNTTAPFHVGLVLDLDSLVGKVGQSCISMAHSDFYDTHNNYTTRLVLHTRDSKKDVIGAAAAVVDLLKNVEVQTIIGPQKSAQAEFVIDLGDKAQVPIISFSATSPSLPFRSPYFVRTAQNDSSQIKAITAIIQSFEWREVVPIFEDTIYGNGFIPYLIDALQGIDTRVKYRRIISLSATDEQILEEFYKLMTMENRVFVVHMTPILGSRLFLKAKEAGMMSEGFAWIITAGLMSLMDSMDSHVIEAMQGVLGAKPFIPRSEKLDNFKTRWKREFHQINPNMEKAELSISGLWAYDTTWALAMAAEAVDFMHSQFQKTNITRDSTDLVSLGISQTGPKLLKAILETRFTGLSGEFQLINGELQPSVFQVLNVIGKGEREVGFWTSANGISRELKFTSEETYSSSRSDFRPIIWPGESTNIPKGWVIPVSGKKLRIGVPVKYGYTEFVKVERDPQSNKTVVSGFCIDVFNLVMKKLPYAVPYEFIPFAKADGSSAGNYNDLVYQVYLKKFDALVGDPTILANRSLYVDFTLPYTEGGVTMVVPIKYEDEKSAWIFLRPLTKDLWLTSGAFFILTGIVIWVLEHRINDAFRGPPSQHVGMIFWFPLSTLVSAQREKVLNNLTRIVVIIWMFVVLILNSSYTASLSSMLTVQRLQPTVTSIEELKKNKDFVGYQQGSFVLGLLKRLNFDESKLKPCKTAAVCDEALLKGSQNGGISAYFELMPFVKVFLAKYCDKYTMVGPLHNTDGFGFVFPRGSPLVADISTAILNVAEGDEFVEIERASFGNPGTCSGPSTNIISSSLTLNRFRGLFIITGTVSGFALIVYLSIYFHKNGHVLKNNNSRDTVWSRIHAIFKLFDHKDYSYHIFNKKEGSGGQVMEERNIDASADASISRSLSSVSTNTSRSIITLEEGMIPFEQIVPNLDLFLSEEMVDVSLSE